MEEQQSQKLKKNNFWERYKQKRIKGKETRKTYINGKRREFLIYLTLQLSN